MQEKEMTKVIAEAAVALEQAKARIELLELELAEAKLEKHEYMEDSWDWQFMCQLSENHLKDAERRIQFLEKIL